MARALIAASRRWNERKWRRWSKRTPHTTELITTPDALTLERVEAFAPDYLFFPHWSWKIPAALYERWPCVVFHMTDLPFGRGGSPLQNLVARGLTETKLSALQVVEAMDAGPIYLKRPLSLFGSAEEIFLRAADLAFEMIDEILEQRPTPVPQEGTPVEFKRRKPEESRIGEPGSLAALHDFIRMLDAEGYPPAFLEHGGFRFELKRAALTTGAIHADVRIVPIAEESE